MWERKRGRKDLLHWSKPNNVIQFESQFLMQSKALAPQLCVCCRALGLRMGLGVTIIRPPREDISRPWPVRWWNCTRNQHIFHTKSKQQLPPVAALNHQPVRLTARPRTWLKKPNDHLALHALWWLAQKCAKEEVLASHFTSPEQRPCETAGTLANQKPKRLIFTSRLGLWETVDVVMRVMWQTAQKTSDDSTCGLLWKCPTVPHSGNPPKKLTKAYLMKTIFQFPLHY